MNRLSERPPFNEAHPPLMEDIDELVEGQTELSEIGQAIVAGDNFDFVIDHESGLSKRYSSRSATLSREPAFFGSIASYSAKTIQNFQGRPDMGGRITLKEGNVQTYSTRPVGLNTALFLEAGEHDAEAIWHIELCCKDDNVVNLEPGEQRKLNISEAAGALVTVRNSGWSDFSCWTDY